MDEKGSGPAWRKFPPTLLRSESSVFVGLVRSVGAALSVFVAWEKGRSDCVFRHDAQMVDVRERNVRKTVLLAMLVTVLIAPIKVGNAVMG